MSVSRCLPEVASNMYEKNINFQISNLLRSWFCLGKRHSSLLYAAKKQSHERCSAVVARGLVSFHFCSKRIELIAFCATVVPLTRFGIGSSSFGCGAAVGFPDPSFGGERPDQSMSRWVWVAWVTSNLPGAPQSIRRVTAKAHAFQVRVVPGT